MELLAPAGGKKQLIAALRYGADAVYGGLKQFGLRAAAQNFNWDGLREAVTITHQAGKRFYLTLNILPREEEFGEFAASAERACGMGIDGAIVSDLGAFACLRKQVPDLALHVSTQANVMNSAGAAVYTDMGAARIVLSRELSLEQIAVIRKKIPENVEFEAFVHGAMCMSHSGRCMLSDYLTGRGANRGACTQPCRWEYTVLEAKRPDDPMPVIEDERGTYIFSAYDLNMLGYLPEMRNAGIFSLKIEGKMKTDYYVATVTRAYRHALDLLEKSGEEAYRAALPELQEELLKASHRASNTGFYFGAPRPASGAGQTTQTMNYIGRVLGMQDGMMKVEVKNRIEAGQEIEVLTPEDVFSFAVPGIIREDTGEETGCVTVAGAQVLIPVPFTVSSGDYLRGHGSTCHSSSSGSCGVSSSSKDSLPSSVIFTLPASPY